MLDIRDLAMMSTSSDEIEELPSAWLESDEPTIADLAGEETTMDFLYDEVEDDDPSNDRELDDLVAGMTAELCKPREPRRAASRRR